MDGLPPRREGAVYRAGVLGPEDIAAVRAFADGVPSQEGTVRALEVDPGIRISTIRWLKPHPAHGQIAWLFVRVRDAMRELNGRYFGFDVDWDRAIDFQFTEYRPGHFYAAHEDMAMEQDREVERKLSCSILLSDPAEHAGGELIVSRKRLRPGKMTAPGTLIAFPSYVPHEVTPVTSGMRCSLVAWYMGPRWR